MKKILFVGIMFMSAPFVSFAQTVATGTVGAPAPVAPAVASVDPGLVPGDFFYFLDRWGEEVNTFFTFNKEKKARKHLDYAKERVAEMKAVLKNPEAKLADIASAKENFDTQVADAANIVKSEKDSGLDVSKLARELDDELDVSSTELKDVLRGYGDDASQAEAEIRSKLADLPVDAPQAQGLKQALESITKEKQDAMDEEGNIDTNIADDQALFEEVMGTQMAAEKHMEQALRLRDHLEGVAGQLPTQASEQLMKQAQEAMKRGDFEAAKRMSKDAEHGLEEARKSENGTESYQFFLDMEEDARMMEETRNTEDSGDMGKVDLDSLERAMSDSERAIENLGR